MGRILLVFLAAVALPGYAQTVQKCVDASGQHGGSRGTAHNADYVEKRMS